MVISKMYIYTGKEFDPYAKMSINTNSVIRKMYRQVLPLKEFDHFAKISISKKQFFEKVPDSTDDAKQTYREPSLSIIYVITRTTRPAKTDENGLQFVLRDTSESVPTEEMVTETLSGVKLCWVNFALDAITFTTR